MNYEYLKKLIKEISKIMNENKEYLIELDSVVGDGDLGLTMSDGFKAAYDAIYESDEKDCGKILYSAGKAMSTAVPSTMGTLMASGLMEAGKALKGKENLQNTDIVVLFENYALGVQKRGKAKVGEKTFLDGIYPAVESLKESINSNINIKQMSKLAYEASKQGFESTTNMVAVHGRAATRGENSRTLKDPGACVAMFIMKAFENINDM